METDIKIEPLYCKTCLSKEKELFNLSEQCDFNDSLENILYKCCDVLIDIPGVKNLICIECKYLLLTFYKFKEQCKKSESTLLSFININVVNIEKLLTKESAGINSDRFKLNVLPEGESQTVKIEVNSDRFKLNAISEDESLTVNINEGIKIDPLELNDLPEDLHIKEEPIDSNIGTTEINNFEEYNSQIEGFTPLIPQIEGFTPLIPQIEGFTPLIPQIEEHNNVEYRNIELNENYKNLSIKNSKPLCTVCLSLNCSCAPNNVTPKNILHICIRKERIKCPECQAVFVDRTKMEEHLEIHSQRKEYFCIICKAVFYEESELLEHVAQHKADLYVRCHICLELFSRERGLQRHIERYHNGNVVKKKPRRSNSIKHVKIGNRPPITCPVCNEPFLQYKLLAKHMKIHDTPLPFICDECGKTFANLDNLQEHKQVHAAQKFYMCSICGRSYEKKVDLNEHLKTH